MKIARYVAGQETQPIQGLRNINQAKYLETEEGDIGSYVDSKVRDVLNCVITAMQSTIRSTSQL